MRDPILEKRVIDGVITLALLAGSLVALSVAVHWKEQWLLTSQSEFRISTAGELRWMGMIVVAGGLFAVAVFPQRSFRYRFRASVLLSILPIAAALWPIGWREFGWQLPPTWLGYLLFSESRYALAALAGVALASGFTSMRPKGPPAGRHAPPRIRAADRQTTRVANK